MRIARSQTEHPAVSCLIFVCVDEARQNYERVGLWRLSVNHESDADGVFDDLNGNETVLTVV